MCVYGGFWEGGFELSFPFPDAWVDGFVRFVVRRVM